MKKALLLIALLSFTTFAYASDYHQRNQKHRITYVVTDNNGNPVTGETIRLQIQRVSDDAVYDFSDSTFKYSSWTTRYQTLTYNVNGEYYTYTFSQDAARFNSGEYVMVVSNDSTTYGDQQAVTVNFDTLSDQIRVNR